MTKLKYTIELSQDCDLIITDTTGFSTDNNTGFTLENALTTPIGDYKLSNGYFLDVITVQRYNGNTIAVLTGNFINIPTSDVVPIYANNFVSSDYILSQDSTFIVNRFFIMSKVFYDQEKSTSRFNGLTVYYTDGTTIYKVVNDVATPITVAKLISESETESTNLITKTTFVSICYLKKCYQYLIQLSLAKGCLDCKEDPYKKNRDLIQISLKAIEYLEDTGYSTEIQKIIEMLDICGSICKNISSTSNCGCNG